MCQLFYLMCCGVSLSAVWFPNTQHSCATIHDHTPSGRGDVLD